PGEVPGAGDALSRRDRIGLGEGSVGGDQVAPQRRRIARGYAVRTDRTAAGPVQGRSTEDRAGARATRRDTGQAPVPRSGTRRARARRGYGRKTRDVARRRCGGGRRDSTSGAL